jgi:hypothetical protein
MLIADDRLERLPEPSTVGKASVGGNDFHKQRMRRVAEAVLALSWRPGGFASELVDQGARSHRQPEGPYGPRQPPTMLMKKLRGKQMVERIGQTRPYEATPAGLQAIAALVVLPEKAIRRWAGRRPTTPAIARTTEPHRAGPSMRNRPYRYGRRFSRTRSSCLNIDKKIVRLCR